MLLWVISYAGVFLCFLYRDFLWGNLELPFIPGYIADRFLTGIRPQERRSFLGSGYSKGALVLWVLEDLHWILFVCTFLSETHMFPPGKATVITEGHQTNNMQLHKSLKKQRKAACSMKLQSARYSSISKSQQKSKITKKTFKQTYSILKKWELYKITKKQQTEKLLKNENISGACSTPAPGVLLPLHGRPRRLSGHRRENLSLRRMRSGFGGLFFWGTHRVWFLVWPFGVCFLFFWEPRMIRVCL